MRLDPEDSVWGASQGSLKVGLLAREAHIQLPEDVGEPHPDLIGLASLVMVRPWVTRRLGLQSAVSSEFADLVYRLFGLEVSPVDDGLPPRVPGSVPVLAYSAGFDSTAASLLLPDGIPHIHHRRAAHPRVPDRSGWRNDAIEALVRRAGQRGRNAQVVRADFEYLCHPFPTLPHWFGFAVGPLLMADHFDAGAIALGGTLETYYMDMGRKWTGPPRLGSGIDPLAELVGMPIIRPTVGLTEVGTMRLSLESDLADAARSCVLGTANAPCGRCAKCIRKSLLSSAVTGRVAPSLTELTDAVPGWKAIADAPLPLYMQAQIEYALARVAEPPSPLAGLVAKLRPDAGETQWMERAYGPAVARGVPEAWQGFVSGRIASSLGWMSDSDVSAAHSWMRPRSGAD